jgi:CRP/FNR family cyclic AMP-dependent transcriptional regulator
LPQNGTVHFFVIAPAIGEPKVPNYVTNEPQTPRIGRDFAVGEVLFREGETGTQMFVIQSGAVRVTKSVGDDEHLIATLGRGEFVGEMAILNNKARSATATVTEAATCLVIDAKTLEAMISKNSEIAIRLIKKLAGRLDQADAIIQILLHRDPKARVMLGLKRHAETDGQQTDDGIVIHLTADALAAEVGADPAHVTDVLYRLKRLRILSEEPEEGTIVVADIGGLLEFMEFLEMPRKFEKTSATPRSPRSKSKPEAP